MYQSNLSIVMPVFNEERTLRTIIDRVHAANPEAELIMVDDGSTDGSLAILRELAGPNDQVISKDNGGKGSALRAGFAVARGTYVVVQDADLEYDPKDIAAMLRMAETGNIPAVFGSRRIIDQHQYAHVKFYIGGVILTWIFNVLFGMHLTDQPNCYKMVRRDILQSLRLTEDDFRLDSELAALLARLGVPIAEYPTVYHPRSVAEGKKITWMDGILALWVFLKIRLMPKSRLQR